MEKVRLQALESLGKSVKDCQISTVALFHSKLEKIGGVKTRICRVKQELAELGIEPVHISNKASKY